MEFVEIPAEVAEQMKEGGKPSAFWFDGVLITQGLIAAGAIRSELLLQIAAAVGLPEAAGESNGSP